MRPRAAAVLAAIATIAAAGCGKNDAGTTASSAGATAGAGSGGGAGTSGATGAGGSGGAGGQGPCVGPTGCGAVCELGNSRGIGHYCSKGGGECSTTPDQYAPYCTIDFSDATTQGFCTRMCQSDDQCGEDATCIGQGGPKGCVPNFCLGPTGAGGAGGAGAGGAGGGGAAGTGGNGGAGGAGTGGAGAGGGGGAGGA